MNVKFIYLSGRYF